MKGDDVSKLSADDAALLDQLQKNVGGRLGHKPPCVKCGAAGRLCGLTLPSLLGRYVDYGDGHPICDPFALCFACAKMEYTAMVIAGE